MSSAENILLVTTDSLRADHIYGDTVETPTHDALAEEGTTYDRAFAQGPFTTFSMPSLFTSRYPSGLDYLEFSDKTVGVYIDEVPTITEVLSEAGYHTAGLHSNPLLSNLFGFDRGFDTFDARLPLTDTDFVPGRIKILTDKLLRLVRKHAYLPAEKLTTRALDWLDNRDDDRPFFLWVHYMDVHGPYQAKEGNVYLNKYRGERIWRKCLTSPEAITPEEHERLRELYRTEIEYTDREIGRLLDGLRDRGLYDRTTTIATADHGEQFGEYGNYSHPHQLYDVLTHVPLIVRGPETDGTHVTDIVELTDVAPTLAHTAGVSSPATFRGTVLPPEGESPSRPSAVSEADLTPAYHGSVRTEEWKYIRDDTSGTELLLDTDDPIGERDDCSGDHPEVRRELAERLDDHIAETDRTAGESVQEATHDIEDSDIENRLEELGYLE
jgi:arylsulfatase A-like enzyme